MRIRIRSIAILLGTGVLVGAAVAPSAWSQVDFPSKPVRLIAAVPPGSPPDLVARIVAEPLGRALGQAVLVENRPGANQTIGLDAVAKAVPDGHALAMVSLPSTVVPSLMAQMPYDMERDFSPVREVAWGSNVLVVGPGGAASSVSELIAAAKARPGKLTFASGGNGTPAHVLGELFRQQAGLDIAHVPFKGAVEGVNAVMAGHVDFMFAAASAVVPHVRGARIRALAQSSESRLQLLPEVSTFAELGLREIVVRDWQGIAAPARTPEAVIQKIATVLGEVLARPETRERLRALAMEPVAESGPASFKAFMGAELRRWAAVAKASGLQAQ